MMSPEWQHYNSRIGRNCKTKSNNIYAQDARKMKNYLAKKTDETRRSNGMATLTNLEGKALQIIYTPCPQQPDTSLDCVLYVCKYMDQLVKAIHILNAYTETTIDDLRVDIANEILNDPIHSWTATPDLFWTQEASRVGSDTQAAARVESKNGDGVKS